MRKKRGFTLIEMMLVIAIIVILSAIFVAGMNRYLSKANGAQSTVSVHVGKYSSAKTVVDSLGVNP